MDNLDFFFEKCFRNTNILVGCKIIIIKVVVPEYM
jgi:hypothetical protein